MLPEGIVAFTREFIDAKQVQWTAFHKRLAQDHVPAEFGEIVTSVEAFLGPVASALISGTQVPQKWTAPGPWA